MYNEAIQAINDAMTDDLPTNTDNFSKIKCSMENGTRVWWYYKEDLEYFKEYIDNVGSSETVQSAAPFSGIAITLPGVEYNGSIEENIIIVIDTVPCEKCYPEIEWVALDKLIDDNDLIEVFVKD